MTKPLFENALAQYSQSLGLKGVHLDEVHGACLEFDQKIELSMQWSQETGSVHAIIFCDFLPKIALPNLYGALLSGNFLWLDTGGATLSVDKASNSIFLIARWDAEAYATAESLSDSIDSLVNCAEIWQLVIKKTVQANSAKSITASGADNTAKSSLLETSHGRTTSIKTASFKASPSEA